MTLLLLAACSDYDVAFRGKGPGFDEGEDIPDPVDTSTTGTTDSTPPPDTGTRPTCVDQSFPSEAVPVVEAPERTPVTYEPTVLWDDTDEPQSTYYTHVAGRLVDSDGDGEITEADEPAVVQLRLDALRYEAIRGGDGTSLWVAGTRASEVAVPAIVDVDGDGFPDLVGGNQNAVVAHDGRTGAELWSTSVWTRTGSVIQVSAGDLDGDGTPEIVSGDAIFGADGTLRGRLAEGYGCTGLASGVSLADLDLDGRLEIVAGNTVYDDVGNVLARVPVDDGATAVGNFDGDPEGEFVVVGSSVITLADTDGTVIWSQALPQYSESAPLVADLDGDGEAEIGVATYSGYFVYEADGSIRWSAPTQDMSSAYTGSSAFDFDGDGAFEVVYADELDLWIFDGRTGDVLLDWVDHASATAAENPVIADVDGDGSVDIVFGDDDGPYPGTVAINDPTWPGAPGTWEQYGYVPGLVSEVGDARTAPAMPWTYGPSLFRAQTNAYATAGLPNLAVGIADVCDVECADGRLTVWVQVENDGPTDVPVGFTLELWATGEAGDTLLDTMTWPATVPAGTRSQSVDWVVEGVAGPVDGVAVVADGTDTVIEREEGDNRASAQGPFCE